MELYRNGHYNTAKQDAQDNLRGRTHYVDDSTLKFHHSKVLFARAVDNGLLYAIITSDALDMNNTKRGFRYTIFDLFGKVVARPNLEDAFKSRKQAEKAMWQFLNSVNAVQITAEAIEWAEKCHAREMEELRGKVAKISAEKVAA